MPSGLFYYNSSVRSISSIRGGWLVFINTIIEMHVFNTNSVYPDQRPHTAASDLGLHCFPISL